MRIAIIAPYPPNPQGEAHYCGEFVRALLKADPSLAVGIFAHAHPGESIRSESPEGALIFRVLQPDTVLGRNIGCARLFSHVRRFGPDIVHFEGGLLPYFGGRFGEPLVALTALLRTQGYPQIVTLHSTWLAMDIRKLALNAGWPGPIAGLVVAYYSLLTRLFSATVDSFCLMGTDGYSPILRQFIRDYRIAARNVLVEPHPCVPRFTTPEEQAAAKLRMGIGNMRLVLATGFVRRDKGLDVLLQCASQLCTQFPDVVVGISGSPGREKDEAYARELARIAESTAFPERVRLRLEYLSPEEFSTQLDAADILVVPYLRSVGPSGPIHHALGRGKVVVASNIGHNTSLGSACYLVPPGETKALGDALHDLLANPSRMQHWQDRARSYAGTHTWDDLAAAYLHHYKDLLAGRPLSDNGYLRRLPGEMRS